MTRSKVTERVLRRLAEQVPSVKRDTFKSLHLEPSPAFVQVIVTVLEEYGVPVTGFWDVFVTQSSLRLSQAEWNALARIARERDYHRSLGDLTPVD